MQLNTIDKQSDGVLPDTVVAKITHLNVNSLTVQDKTTSATIKVQNYDIQSLKANCCYGFIFLEVRQGNIWVRRIYIYNIRYIDCFESVQNNFLH